MTRKIHLNNFPIVNDIEILENPERIKKKKKKKVIIPQRKICEVCKKRRVKNHHHLCNYDWKRLHKSQKEIDNEKVKEF